MQDGVPTHDTAPRHTLLTSVLPSTDSPQSPLRPAAVCPHAPHCTGRCPSTANSAPPLSASFQLPLACAISMNSSAAHTLSTSSVALALLLLLLGCTSDSFVQLVVGQSLNADFGRELFSIDLGPGLNHIGQLAVDSSASYLYVIDFPLELVAASRLRQLNYTTGEDVSAAFHSDPNLSLNTSAGAVTCDRLTTDVFVSDGPKVFRLSSSGATLFTYPQVFREVVALTTDWYGNLLVEDETGGVYNISANGTLLGQQSSESFTYTTSIAVDSHSNLYYPGVVVDQYGLVNVGVISPSGSSLANLSVSGFTPTSVWVSAEDVLYVSWASDYAFYVAVQAPGYVLSYDTTTFQVTGNFSANANTCPTTVAGDNLGHLVYGDCGIVQLVKLQLSTGDVVQTIRNGVYPELFSVDDGGNMYMIDVQAGAVLVLNSTGGSLRYFPAPTDGSLVLQSAAVDAAGTFLVGLQNDQATLHCYNVSSGALISTVQTGISIGAVAVDSSLSIYVVVEFYGAPAVVQVLSQQGAPTFNFTTPMLDYYVSLFIDSHDRLYVTNNTATLQYSLNGTLMRQWATDVATLLVDSSGDLYDLSYVNLGQYQYGFDVTAHTPDLSQEDTVTLGLAADSSPSGIALDPAGDFYISDSFYHSITKYRGLVTTVSPALSSSSSSSSAALSSPSSLSAALPSSSSSSAVAQSSTALSAATLTSTGTASSSTVTAPQHSTTSSSFTASNIVTTTPTSASSAASTPTSVTASVGSSGGAGSTGQSALTSTIQSINGSPSASSGRLGVWLAVAGSIAVAMSLCL